MCNRWALLFALLFLFGSEATAQTPDPDPNSKSAAEFAEFMLTTCLAAMHDLAKVEVMARENNWTDKTPSVPDALSKYINSRSVWEVMQGENKFIVMIWVNVSVPPLKVCAVSFPVRNVKRDDFFNSISSSLELTFMADTRFPQRRSENYEIKSDRTNKLVLNIMSQNDGTLIGAMVEEMRRFAPRQTAPAAAPEVTMPTSRPQTAIQRACSEQATARELTEKSAGSSEPSARKNLGCLRA
jgi:hypothetical protein